MQPRFYFRRRSNCFGILLFLVFSALNGYGQVESEIQVYASPTVGNRQTIFELHSNYTIRGTKMSTDPFSVHYLNESLEITHGFGDNFELGCYFFTTLNPSGRYEYLGSHIRPRISVPSSWNWKVGVSLSAEFGFFRQGSRDPFYWEGEIRPILDKTKGNWYFSFNPNINFVLTGDDRHWGLGPQFKTVYTIQKKYGLGFEYYTELGTFRKINPLSEEEHLLGPMLDLYLNPRWELNSGFLFGLTPHSNQRAIKLIIGRRT